MPEPTVILDSGAIQRALTRIAHEIAERNEQGAEVVLIGIPKGGVPLAGYEMHMGVTAGADCARPFARLAGGLSDGAVSADGRVIGTYIHGLFADDRQRAAWLARLGDATAAVAYDDLIEQTLDALAAHLAAHVDLDRLLTLAR